MLGYLDLGEHSAIATQGYVYGGFDLEPDEALIIEFDVPARELRLKLSDEEIAERVAAYAPPPPPFRSGVLAKYSRQVGSASEGAITA